MEHLSSPIKKFQIYIIVVFIMVFSISTVDKLFIISYICFFVRVLINTVKYGEKNVCGVPVSAEKSWAIP